jgi:manganese oxidase
MLYRKEGYMIRTAKKQMVMILGFLIMVSIFFVAPARATIDGLTGTVFNFTAKPGYVLASEGSSILMWGYGVNGNMQYPGPTLILNEGDLITVTVTNQLSVPTSIVFPGQANVTASGGIPGLLAREALPGATVTYYFTASNPGTYTYYSGTHPDLQVMMGLVGAIIVRPVGLPAQVPNEPIAIGRAYGHDDSRFNRETLFLLTEIDPRINRLVEQGRMDEVDTTTFKAAHWFINGRDAPDTLAAPFEPTLPNQPYNSLPRMHPKERMLLRMIGGGRDYHPFHCHGNQHNQIAKDARLMQTAPGNGADMLESVFTSAVGPGQTIDAFFSWTGQGLGWDVYGHAPSDPLEPYEDLVLGSHGLPVPVTMPSVETILAGQFFSGSPYLGSAGQLPPGEGGFNPTNALFYMWHSHAERELTSNNIFPGGMLTFGIVEKWDVIIEPGNP